VVDLIEEAPCRLPGFSNPPPQEKMKEKDGDNTASPRGFSSVSPQEKDGRLKKIEIMAMPSLQ